MTWPLITHTSWAAEILRHLGANDPETEGWVQRDQSDGEHVFGPVNNDLGTTDAWNITTTDESGDLTYCFDLSPSQINEALSSGWSLRARLRVIDSQGSDGHSLQFRSGNWIWALTIKVNDSGDPVVGLMEDGREVTALDDAGLYHLYELRDEDHDGLAEVWIDDEVALTGYSGFEYDWSAGLIEFGDHMHSSAHSGNINYALVDFHVLSPVPVVVAVETNTNVRIDFSSPSRLFDYVIEQSTDLLPGSWQPVPNAGLGQIGALSRFTTARPASGENYYRVAMVRPLPPVHFSEDFESGAEGWTATTTAGDTEWELGTPSATNLTEAHSGEQVYGTDLDAALSNGADASLRSPVIDLTGDDCAILQFWHFVDATIESDGAKLRIHSEDGTLLHEREEIFWGTTEEWTKFSMAIPAEAQGRKIRLEWLLLTDDAEPNGDGFFLDDVVVRRCQSADHLDNLD